MGTINEKRARNLIGQVLATSAQEGRLPPPKRGTVWGNHRWQRSQRSGFLDECAVCSLERSVDPHAHPPGARYWLPGLLGHAADSVLRPSLSPFQFEMLPWAGTGWRLFLKWNLGQIPAEDCLLALDYSRRGHKLRTETRILLPCPGESTTDWRSIWLAHLRKLIAAAQGSSCPRCRAQPGAWCRTPSHHGVPGLHRERLARSPRAQGVAP